MRSVRTCSTISSALVFWKCSGDESSQERTIIDTTLALCDKLLVQLQEEFGDSI